MDRHEGDTAVLDLSSCRGLGGSGGANASELEKTLRPSRDRGGAASPPAENITKRISTEPENAKYLS